MDYDLAVYIGRFQPIHLAHLEIMKQALEKADNLLVVIGSRSKIRRTTKNPWNSEERQEMIFRALKEAGVVTHRVYFTSVFDVYKDDAAWFEQVHNEIGGVIHDVILDPVTGRGPVPKVTLMGHTKDASSYYLQTFPGITYSPATVPQHLLNLNATDIRRMILEKDGRWQQYVPAGAKEFLQDWLLTHDLPKEEIT